MVTNKEPMSMNCLGRLSVVHMGYSATPVFLCMLSCLRVSLLQVGKPHATATQLAALVANLSTDTVPLGPQVKARKHMNHSLNSLKGVI